MSGNLPVNETGDSAEGDTSSPKSSRAPRGLSSTVADQILADIFAGRMQPGERLKETALCEAFKASRPTIREALISLEASGVVERTPGAGAKVAEFRRSDIEALYEARAGILALCVMACTERMGRSVAQRLKGLTQQMQALTGSDDDIRAQHAALAIEAQRLIAVQSGNRYLSDFHEQLLNMALSRLVRQQGFAFHLATRRAESARDWLRVSRAIEKGDGTGASAAIKLLMAHSAETVLSQPIYGGAS